MKTGEVVIELNKKLIKFSRRKSDEVISAEESRVFEHGVKFITMLFLSDVIPAEINNVKAKEVHESLVVRNFVTGKAFIQATNHLHQCIHILANEKLAIKEKYFSDQIIWKVDGDVARLIKMKLSTQNFARFQLRVGYEFYLEEWQGAHPLFKCPSQLAVFQTRDAAVAVMQNMLRHDVLASEINELFQSRYHRITDSLKHPFIVVEGLDGTGKSTTVKNLSKRINAHVLTTPPSLFSDFREKFDKLSEICRRAYYSFGNYFINQEIVSICQERPVILDRYWYSTAAFAIASQSACGVKEHLPVRKHSVYRFPADLLKPDAVILLTVSDEVRKERLLRRPVHSAEEKIVNQDIDFSKRIMAVYDRLTDDTWITINTGISRSKSLNKILQELQLRNIIS